MGRIVETYKRTPKAEAPETQPERETSRNPKVEPKPKTEALQPAKPQKPLSHEEQLLALASNPSLPAPNGSMNSTIESNNRIVRKYPKAMYYMQRGEAHLKNGDYRKAALDMNKATELEPENIRNYIKRIQLWLALGDVEGAKREAQKAIAIDATQDVYVKSYLNLYLKKFNNQ